MEPYARGCRLRREVLRGGEIDGDNESIKAEREEKKSSRKKERRDRCRERRRKMKNEKKIEGIRTNGNNRGKKETKEKYEG